MARRSSSQYKASRQRVKQNLATKRKSAAILRRAGLIKRSAAQTDKKYLSGSYFRELRRRYADVIEGSSKSASASPDIARVLKAAGYRVKKTTAGTFRVIVPMEVQSSKPITRRKAVALVQQPAPVSPKPVKPRPSHARIAQPKKPHSFDDCLRGVIEWFRLNKEDGYGPLEEREQNLIRLAMQNPEIFRSIIRASHNDAQRYLRGEITRTIRKQGNGDIVAVSHGTRWQDKYPRTAVGLDFRHYFPELFYYHPTTSSYLATGGVIPRC